MSNILNPPSPNKQSNFSLSREAGAQETGEIPDHDPMRHVFHFFWTESWFQNHSLNPELTLTHPRRVCLIDMFLPSSSSSSS